MSDKECQTLCTVAIALGTLSAIVGLLKLANGCRCK